VCYNGTAHHWSPGRVTVAVVIGRGRRAWSLGRFVTLQAEGEFVSIVIRIECRSLFVVCRFFFSSSGPRCGARGSAAGAQECSRSRDA
jgi:hypothetical protein